MKNYLEVIVEDVETKDVKKFDVKTMHRAMTICNKYYNSHRVMINRVDEIYGVCENIFDNKDVIDGLKEMEDELNEAFQKGERKMTYTKLLEWAEENTNMNLADVALAEMMDIVEEETGTYPRWNDEVPQWILDNFGYKK